MPHFSGAVVMDDAWMENRRQMREWQARMESSRLMMESLYGSHRHRDTSESLADDYATGKIDLDTFERRLDKVLA